MANYIQVSHEIVDAVGGKENIVSVFHCTTRLRLVLKDKKKYDAKVIDKIKGVQGLFFNSGQLQIIFDLNVPKVYKAFVESTDISRQSQITGGEKPKNKIVLWLL